MSDLGSITLTVTRGPRVPCRLSSILCLMLYKLQMAVHKLCKISNIKQRHKTKCLRVDTHGWEGCVLYKVTIVQKGSSHMVVSQDLYIYYNGFLGNSIS